MPTMVQQPDLINTTVSNLQAIDRPVERTGLSSFLSELLPQVAEGVQAYQEDSKNNLIAQGINDELYGTHREVGILDRHNYKQGVEFQKVTSTRTANQRDYLTRMQELVDQGASDEQIADLQKNFLAQNSDAIHNSDLLPELKAKVYESNVADNAVYLKASAKAQQQAIAKRAVGERNTRVSHTLDLFLNAQSDDDIETILSGYTDLAVAAQFAVDASADPMTVHNAVKSDLKGMFDFARMQFEQNPDQYSAQYVNNMRKAAVVAARKGVLDITTLTDMLSSADSVQDKIYKRNETNSQIEMNNAIWSVQSGETPYSAEVVDGIHTKLLQGLNSGLYTPEYYAKATESLYRFGETQTDKILNKKVTAIDVITQGMSKSEALINWDISEDQYDRAVIQTTLASLGTQDPTAQSIALMDKAISGDTNGEYLPKVMQEGVQKASAQIMRYMALDAVTASKLPDYGTAQQQFEALKSRFNALDQRGSRLATDLLEPFGDQRALVAQIFRTGGSMHDAQDSIANPATHAQKQINFTSAKDKLETVKARPYMGLGSGTFGGTIFKGTPEYAQGTFYSQLRVAAENDPLLVKDQLNGSAESLIDNMQRKGTLMTDPNGYNAIILTPRAADNLKKAYQGKDLSTVYAPKVISQLRQRVANDHKISATATIVTADRTGRFLSIIPVGEKGNSLFKGQQGVKLIPMDEVYNLMTKEYNSAMDAKAKRTVTYTNEELDGSGAKSVINFFDPITRTIRKAVGGSKPQSYSIDTSGNIGSAAIKFNTGGSANVRIPTQYVTAFNGNPEIARAFHSYVQEYEGFLPHAKIVKGTGTDNDGYILGNGINLNSYKNSSNPAHQAFFRKAMAAQGNPQAIMNLQGEFIADNFKGGQKVLQQAGIPPATKSGYPKQFLPAQLLVADYKWHSGNYNAIAGILKAPTLAEAKRLMKSSRAYTHADDKHRRNQTRMQMLEQTFAALGKR